MRLGIAAGILLINLMKATTIEMNTVLFSISAALMPVALAYIIYELFLREK